jgi:Family of unknown function (DUF5519)
VPDARLQFMKRCAGIAGAALGEGAFSPGPAIRVGKREVAHFDGQDELDVRLTREAIRKRRPELRSDERVELRPGTSDWIRVRTKSKAEIDRAFELVREAVAANLPTASTSAARS